MKRIGITQRRDIILGGKEVRDALDVNWASLLYKIGLLPIPLCSEIENHTHYFQALGLDGFILSGGNDIGEMPKRDELELAILEYSKQNSLPVLGVCRGMQYINNYQDGLLVKVSGHVAIDHTLLIGLLPVQLGITKINSFHNFAIKIEGLGKDLIPLMETEDGVIEAIKHKIYPWLGIMWHPERKSTPDSWDVQIIKSHFLLEAK
ncbi:gamma-glutamyl-gamma-aminobutyrate hydrolase family protein [Vibrio tarriae]|uniref:Glutamine amidotransferase n=1 Tax=Vibrio tarriae TaxID=2014742 RepID=A0AAU8WKF7_9VIBR|nr:gamma-glutamyl-gamma-aminobutyrate hydrolase family protein [Vibrio tarriae]ASK56517.1 glutamine amidotransferase [Vibrio tarriae]RBM34004.1 glutamine amidotransferase [Vibrio tarriae]